MSTTVVEGYQLSPQQKRLWQLGQGLCDLPRRARCTVLLKGTIDITNLRLAFQRVIESHEILRTQFQTIPGMSIPLQVIDDATTAWLDYASTPHLATQCSQQDFETLLPYIEQQTPEQDQSHPAIAKLYMLGEALHVLFLDLPSLWLDHQGIESLVSEIVRCYQATNASEAEEPVQYAAVAQWLNEMFEEQEGADGRAYWRDKLALERPNVPFSHAPSMGKRFHPQRLRVVIAPTVVEKITTLTGGSDTGFRSFLLTCLNLLVWSLTEKEDLVIGTAYDGRTEAELQEVPGLFARYLPISTHLEAKHTYAEIWQQVIKTTQEAEGWQDCFDWSLASRIGGKDPTLDYFPLCFEFHHESQEYTTQDLTWSIIDNLVYNDLFDLRLSCMPTKRGLIADFYYNDAVLSHTDAEQFAAYFSTLIQEAAANPAASIDSLEVLAESELYTSLDDLASVQQDLLTESNLSHAFEQQAARTPQNIALTLQGRELTYAELNVQVNKIAHRLQQLQVKAETMVVLCTERSLETIIGLLAILKAGCVCVPLDPAYPEDRQSFILKDSQSPVVLTQEKFASAFSKYPYPLEVVSLDAVDTLKEVEENPISEIDPRQLAYVIYTSGSTGQPKGVGVSHQAALNHFSAMQREFTLSEHDRVLQFASLSFDVSLEQIFPALLCGATVVMRGPTSWSVDELNKAIVEQKLTVINLTPAFWQQWSQAMQAGIETIRHTGLRLVIIGGEAMTLEDLRRWRRTPLGSLRLLNAYGPTETVITATVYEVPEELCPEKSGLKTVPIGWPTANREIYILNKRGKPTARGIPGELYIGSELLARGYLNRPDLTAERFVPHPFSSKAGERLYKTGDLGRYLPDGSIEYLGRIDQQVKIRGFRIELGEIEAVLQHHPDVQTAVVIVREDEPSEKRLVAYVIPQQKHSTTIAGLRSFLEQRLPEYMIPSAFMYLESLPLTVNGKIDRRVLPAPDTSRPELEETFVAPRTPVEETLANIWSEVLAVDQVGIHDNFFQLGGHSLVATQVIARVRTVFQVDVPVHALFQEPTIARLAEKIAEIKSANHGPAIPAIARLRREAGTDNAQLASLSRTV